METFELVLLIDSNGNHAVGNDTDSAIESYENNVGGLGESGGYRLVNISVKAPLAPVELSATIPADGKASMVLA